MIRTRVGVLLLFVATVPAAVSAQATDSVAIVSVHPLGALHRGVPIEVSLVADVVLASMDTAQLAAGFNSDDPRRYRMVASVALHRGRQRVTLKATIVPVDWSAQGAHFAYIVNIRPLEPPSADGRGRGIAIVRGQFELVP